MKALQTLILIMTCLSVLHCSPQNNGGDVTETFLSEYSGYYIDEETGEQITLKPNSSIEVIQHRQVGDGNNITTCSYTLHGEVLYVFQMDESQRQRYKDNLKYKVPHTHNMVFNVDRVSLNDDLKEGTLTDPLCQEFAEDMNSEPPTYNFGMELFGQGVIRFHTENETDFLGLDDHESVLDEVFIRDSID